MFKIIPQYETADGNIWQSEQAARVHVENQISNIIGKRLDSAKRCISPADKIAIYDALTGDDMQGLKQLIEELEFWLIDEEWTE